MFEINNLKKYEYYVYEHSVNGEVFYVGKGKGDRAQDKKYRNVYWKAFVGEKIDEVEIVIKAYFIEEVDALTFEFMLINKYVEEGVLLANINYNLNSASMIHKFGEKASEILREDAMNRIEILKKRDLKMKGKLAFLNGLNDSKIITIRDSYLNKKLTAGDKYSLCEELGLFDEKGRLKKWPTIRKYLVKSGYNVKESSKYDGKRKMRVSIITIKD